MEEQSSLKDKRYDSVDRVFTLREFICAYVETALATARDSPSVDDYDAKVRRDITSRFRLSLSEIVNLEKLFYWYLFKSGNGYPISYEQTSKGPNKVCLKVPEPCGLDHVVDSIFKEYGLLLDARIRKLLTERCEADPMSE